MGVSPSHHPVDSFCMHPACARFLLSCEESCRVSTRGFAVCSSMYGVFGGLSGAVDGIHSVDLHVGTPRSGFR